MLVTHHTKRIIDDSTRDLFTKIHFDSRVSCCTATPSNVLKSIPRIFQNWILGISQTRNSSRNSRNTVQQTVVRKRGRRLKTRYHHINSYFCIMSAPQSCCPQGSEKYLASTYVPVGKNFAAYYFLESC